MGYFALWLMLVFGCGGILGCLLGIHDCKRTYNIPFRATPDDGEWLTHRTLGEIYGLHNARNSDSTEQ